MVDRERLETFSKQVKEEYEEGTIVDEVFDWIPYREEEHGEMEFTQIGRRTRLPKKFFSEDDAYINVQLANDFARSVFLGERNYLLNRLNDFRQQQAVRRYTLEGFSADSLLNALDSIENPTNVFLPLYFHNTVYEWVDEGLLDFEVGEAFVLRDDSRVKIHWLPDKTGFENIFVIDSEEAQIVQKLYKHTEMDQMEVIEDYQFNQADDRLMLYYGPSEDDDEFTFLFRSLLSDPIVDSESVCVVDTSNTDIELEE